MIAKLKEGNEIVCFVDTDKNLRSGDYICVQSVTDKGEDDSFFSLIRKKSYDEYSIKKINMESIPLSSKIRVIKKVNDSELVANKMVV